MAKKVLTCVTYVATLFAVTVWAFPFGTAIWGFLMEPRTEVRHEWSWLFVAFPLVGLWIASALPFLLREVGRPGLAVLATFCSLILGLLTALVLQ